MIFHCCLSSSGFNHASLPPRSRGVLADLQATGTGNWCRFSDCFHRAKGNRGGKKQIPNSEISSVISSSLLECGPVSEILWDNCEIIWDFVRWNHKSGESTKKKKKMWEKGILLLGNLGYDLLLSSVYALLFNCFCISYLIFPVSFAQVYS